MIDIREHGIGAGSGLQEFFGDGSDGALNTTGNVTIPVTANSGIAIKQYTSVKINAGHVLTTNNPCRGLVIYSQGDVTIDGAINMSQKAGLAPNGEIMPMIITKKNSSGEKTLEKYFQLTTVLQALKGGIGGNGGYGGGYSGSYRSTGGNGGGGRQNLGGFGGGGGGGCAETTRIGGDGGDISYNELGYGAGEPHRQYHTGEALVYKTRNGAGGSGKPYVESSGGGAYAITGSGGICFGGGGGGSGGANANSLESGSSSPAGNGEYAGGFILIIAKGNIAINSNGLIVSKGGNGGAGSAGWGGAANNCYASGGGGGGGSGGGVVVLMHKGAYTNNGSIWVDGGLGGAGGNKSVNAYSNEVGGAGASGSVGTIHIQQI